MATITVRDLSETTRSRLRIRAAKNGRSMEAEVRTILDTAVADETNHDPGVLVSPATHAGGGLGSRIHALFADIGGADDILIEPRARERDLPDFSEPEPEASEAGDEPRHDRGRGRVW